MAVNVSLIGYIYNQRYVIKEENKSGFTRYAVLHQLDENGNICRTNTHKLHPDFDGAVGDTHDTEPYFDKFGRLAGFFPPF